MKKYILLLLVLFSTFTYLDAQSLLRRAEIAYQEHNYRYAADAYEKFYAKKGEPSAEVTIPLANSYYHLNEYAKAQKFYDMTRARDMSAQEFLNYGEMLRKQGLYKEATEKYVLAKKSREKNVSRNRINLGIKACEWADSKHLTDGKGKAILSPSGLDIKGQSFGVRFYEEGIVYSSSGIDVVNRNLDANGKPILNLAYSEKATDSTAQIISGFSGALKSKNHVGSAEFSADGKIIFYTKLVSLKETSKLKIFTAKLSPELGDWVREDELTFCDDAYNYAHPALSLDGEILYFSSDMEGTLGGMDIFKVEKKGSTWGQPQNMGKVINTEATEIFPYITPSGYLSFASNGHPGFGGLDAFWVEMKNNIPVSLINASAPINSTYDDFAAVIDPRDSLSGYISSNRSSKGAYDEIYAMDLTEDYMIELHGQDPDSIHKVAYEDSLRQVASNDSLMQLELVQMADSIAVDDTLEVQDPMQDLIVEVIPEHVEPEMIQGEAFELADPNLLFGNDELGVINTFFVDALSLKLLENATYTITDNITNGIILDGVADNSAVVSLDLKSARVKKDQALTVTVQVKYGDFSSYTLELLSDRMKTYDDTHPIMLTPIMAKRDKVKETIVADEVVTGGAPFSFDGHTLTTEGKAYMDMWADFLIKNPKVKIKLMSHTDGRGDVSYNFKLSQRRSFEAKRYLIAQGVNHMQVIARGYGERYPLVDCKECTEKEHDANRRIEMEVINRK